MVGFCHGGNIPASHPDDDGDDIEEGNDVCVLSLILARGGELCLLLQPLELQPACCPPLASNFPHFFLHDLDFGSQLGIDYAALIW